MPEKRKVAVFRNNFLPYSETFIHDALRHHVRYDPTVFARTWRNEDRFPGHEVVYLERIPGRKKPFEKLIYNKFGKSWTFDSVFTKKRFDIMQAHFGYDGIYALPFAKKYDLPLVVCMWGHDVTILAGKEKNLRRWRRYRAHFPELMETASLFMCNSEDLRRMMLEIGCPPEKLKVLQQGTDLKLFFPAPSHNHQVTMIGRFVEKKGFEDGIRAFAMACDSVPDANLCMVGEGPLQGPYEKIIKEMNIQGRVSLVGVKTIEELIPIIQASHVMMVPSVTAKSGDKEGLPTILKAAFACGVPAIGTRHGGIPEVIDDGLNGFLVNEHDVSEMANRLRELCGNEELHNQMSDNARRKAEREHDIVLTNQTLEKIYDELIHASK